MKEPYPLIRVDVGMIEVPLKFMDDTPINDGLVAELARSMEREGLHAPIGIRINNDNEGRNYLIVFGRQRLAAAKRLGWTEIEARDFGNLPDEDASMITIGENIFRKTITRDQRMVMLKKWHDWYSKQYPDRAGRGANNTHAGREAIAARPTKEAPISFPKLVAATTGKSESTAKAELRIAKAFTEEQHKFLVAIGVSTSDLLKIISASDDPAVRAEICKAVALGIDSIDDCIDHGLKAASDLVESPTPRGTPQDRPVVPAKPNPPGRPRTEIATTGDEFTDEEWLSRLGGNSGNIRKQLRDSRIFDQAALAYRKIREARTVFRRAVEEAIPRIKQSRGLDPFLRVLYRAIYCEHPKEWLICNGCHGKATIEEEWNPGNDKVCNACYGVGFVLTMEKKG